MLEQVQVETVLFGEPTVPGETPVSKLGFECWRPSSHPPALATCTTCGPLVDLVLVSSVIVEVATIISRIMSLRPFSIPTMFDLVSAKGQ
jgi:hypothetical protein